MVPPPKLAASANATGIRIVWSAAWDGEHAGAGCRDLVLGRGGGGGLGGCNCTGKDDNGNESSDDILHGGPLWM